MVGEKIADQWITVDMKIKRDVQVPEFFIHRH